MILSGSNKALRIAVLLLAGPKSLAHVRAEQYKIFGNGCALAPAGESRMVRKTRIHGVVCSRGGEGFAGQLLCMVVIQ